MSVRTEADELIDEAFSLIQEAARKIDTATDSNTWGCDEYKKDHIDKLIDLSYDLKKKLREFR